MPTISSRLHSISAVIIGLLLISSNVIAANLLTMRDGRQLRFRSIRYQERTEEYIVITEAGRFPIPAADVREVRVSEPERWIEGTHLLNNQRYDDAISVFRDIMRDYNKLGGWDLRARGKLAQAYAAQGEHIRALAQYEALFEEISPTVQQRRNYWDSLLAADRYSTLKRELDNVIAEGRREEVAAAYLMRGRVHDAEGNTMEALFDYLRTHILFEEIEDVQPEALYRAADRLDALRDARADELRSRLRERYPRSEYARRAQ